MPARGGARLATGSLLAALTLAVAACGGSSENDESSQAEAWADDVCSVVGAWRDSLVEAQSTLGDVGNLSANDVRDTFEEVDSATADLVSGLEDIGAPETDAGDEAEEELTTLSEQLREQADIVRDAVDQDGSTPSELLARVSTVTGAVSTMITDAASTVEDIRQLDGAEELQDAFESASGCQDLRPGPSESES
jgi:hypothetical protein